MHKVRGYYKPEESFKTIREWRDIANKFLDLQRMGYDTRGGQIDNNPELIKLVNTYFGHQLYVETEQIPDLTRKKVLDFIEDFVNHRVWGLDREFSKYITNINNDKINFFYSRGALEPYVLMDEQFTKDTYGGKKIEITSLHWTSKEGLINLVDSVKNGYKISISTFTTQAKEFFRPESNILVKVKGDLVAAFKSDAKTLVTDRGNRAANMFRLSYPDNEENLCKNPNDCTQNKTHLWNEIVIRPNKVIDYKEVKKY